MDFGANVSCARTPVSGLMFAKPLATSTNTVDPTPAVTWVSSVALFAPIFISNWLTLLSPCPNTISSVMPAGADDSRPMTKLA